MVDPDVEAAHEQEGTWHCRCGTRYDRAEADCPSCGASRSRLPVAELVAERDLLREVAVAAWMVLRVIESADADLVADGDEVALLREKVAAVFTVPPGQGVTVTEIPVRASDFPPDFRR